MEIAVESDRLDQHPVAVEVRPFQPDLAARIVPARRHDDRQIDQPGQFFELALVGAYHARFADHQDAHRHLIRRM